MKIELKLGDGYIALMSNIDCKDTNAFYLLMTFYKSRTGGFNHPVTKSKLDELLKKRNPNYYYIDYDKAFDKGEIE